ncbi:MAG: NB-ARC domain-containing protein, partial [Candidatus Eremiobacteraeota bacterium]|nr:NB-ARC domain-containing protein [Candidatus Eremiobacteraeota bacterium]
MSGGLPLHGILPPAGLPTGTVTFLFSDIEGSTERWERGRPAMQDAVRRHDALLRRAIEAHHGHVFKTIGDAFCAVFARPKEAVQAALDAQHALLAEDFSAVDGVRVRMALHTGTADERDADYFGPTVNRVARLLAIGHGGQVLVSGTAADLLQGEMPAQSSLHDLGSHRLRDLARPENVYQLVASGLSQTFPALPSLDALPNNLPQQLTSFVGRDDEVAKIKALLQKNRLVTLVGTGGAGKTRCAQQIGAELLDGSGDGVWLVELAPTSDPSLVPNVIAHTLGLQESSDRPPLETLLAFLKRKHLLLIVDNCEHVIDEARNVTAAILRGAPDVHVLATSRERLNIAGEQVYRMPSLAVPTRDRAVSAQALLASGASMLFGDRARAADVRFALTDDNAPYVAEICRRLDGIPLAIELAAARIKVLSPRQLLQKLDERFRVLTGGDRSALPRHRTMRALIDWSYDLLSEEERALFRTISIFPSGFALESATAVCAAQGVPNSNAGADGNTTLVAQGARNADALAGGRTFAVEPLDEMAVLDGLSSLVEKSLLQAEPLGTETCYWLLESTRQYARGKLRDCGDNAEIARAHAAAYTERAERLEAAYDTTPDRAWLLQVEPELENWRAALEWTLRERGDVALGQRLAGALFRAWGILAAAEGRRWVHEALGSVDAATPAAVIAKLDLAEAALDTALTQYKASYTAARRALGRYRELPDLRRSAEAQRFAGRALIHVGSRAEGEALLEEALAAARTLGVPRFTGGVLQDLAFARQFADDLDGARARFVEALAIAEFSGAERLAASVANNLAELEFRGGDAPAALRLATDALAAYRASDTSLNVATALCNVAAYLVALGQNGEARTRAHEVLAIGRGVQDDVGIAFTLQHLGAVAALRPAGADAPQTTDRTRAARLLGYVDARLTALEAQREYTEQQEYDRMLAALRDALGGEQLAKLMHEGGAWNEDQA